MPRAAVGALAFAGVALRRWWWTSPVVGVLHSWVFIVRWILVGGRSPCRDLDDLGCVDGLTLGRSLIDHVLIELQSHPEPYQAEDAHTARGHGRWTQRSQMSSHFGHCVPPALLLQHGATAPL